MSGMSWGFQGVVDAGVERPFLNRMRSARQWESDNGMNYAALKANGYLTATGYPNAIPDGGGTNVSTIWANENGGSASEAGDWVLKWDGTATIVVIGDNEQETSSSGRIEFTRNGLANFAVVFTAIDSEDPVDNMVLVKAEHEALHDGGEVFDPKFLNFLRAYPPVIGRFMDWMQTNHSTQEEWADRLTPTANVMWTGESQGGVPVEIMVELANRMQFNPWFTLPHKATDEYITNFATYVKDNLDTDLVAHFEYSNELWNSGFGQNTYCNHFVSPAEDDYWWTAGGNAYEIAGYLATHQAIIIDGVYGVATARRKLVGAIQTGYYGQNDYFFQSLTWATNYTAGVRASPDGKRTLEPYVDPSTVFDVFAPTCYYGGTHCSDGVKIVVTISINSPGVVTWSDHNRTEGSPIRFSTTGTLPTGLVSDTEYYVKTVLSSSTFSLSATIGGAAIVTTGSQSGTHTARAGYRYSLLAQIAASPGNYEPVFDWHTDQLLTRADIPFSIPSQEAVWEDTRVIADGYGIEMIPYEGGSHEFSSAFITFYDDELAILTAYYTEYCYSPSYAEVCNAAWDAHGRQFEGPFMQFGTIGPATQFGAFNPKRSYDDVQDRAGVYAARSRGMEWRAGYIASTTRVA